MTLETIIGLVGLIVTLGTILWQLSGTLTGLREERKKMSDELASMKDAIVELKAALARLEMIPLHEQRIAQLERVVETQGKQLVTLWQKIFSIDKHVAVHRAVSSHDLTVADTDRPPPEE